VDELKDGMTMRAETTPPVAVYRVDGEYFATADSCSHEQWSLGEDGELNGHEVLCPLHMARFDVRDGQALCMPATTPLRSYRVSIEDGAVFVHIEALVAS
jgi:nitrite reductase/ring-hydroxylating ferredoxin subunit